MICYYIAPINFIVQDSGFLSLRFIFEWGEGCYDCDYILLYMNKCSTLRIVECYLFIRGVQFLHFRRIHFAHNKFMSLCNTILPLHSTTAQARYQHWPCLIRCSLFLPPFKYSSIMYNYCYIQLTTMVSESSECFRLYMAYIHMVSIPLISRCRPHSWHYVRWTSPIWHYQISYNWYWYDVLWRIPPSQWDVMLLRKPIMMYNSPLMLLCTHIMNSQWIIMTLVSPHLLCITTLYCAIAVSIINSLNLYIKQ